MERPDLENSLAQVLSDFETSLITVDNFDLSFNDVQEVDDTVRRQKRKMEDEEEEKKREEKEQPRRPKEGQIGCRNSS